MKTFAFALCATLCFSAPAFAQDAAPSQGAAPTSGSEAGAGGKGGKIKEAVQACREQMKAKGMTPGKEMRQAVMDCVGKDHPRMAAVMKCVMEGKEKGLKPKTDEMKSFVKDCQKNGV